MITSKVENAGITSVAQVPQVESKTNCDIRSEYDAEKEAFIYMSRRNASRLFSKFVR